jgi:hypothetical protein
VSTSTSERRLATGDGSWMLWTAAGIAGIWLAVLAISLVAPDLVSGSEHEHLPLAALTAWLWGLVATSSYAAAQLRLRGRASRRPIWIGLTIVTLAVWLVATVLSAALPVYETGTDPTRVPIGALTAPIGAAVLTTLASIVAGVFAQTPEP